MAQKVVETNRLSVSPPKFIQSAGVGRRKSNSRFERQETAYNLRDSDNKLNVPLPHTNYNFKKALAITAPLFRTVFRVI